MTQRISDKRLDEALDDWRCASIAEELIALRAAVRRWIEAENAYSQSPWSSDLRLAELGEARDALRAEMAIIDGGAS